MTSAAPNLHDEKGLVEALRGGDVGAFDRAYALHHRRIFSFLLRLSRRRAIAEDLAQETWLKLAKNARTLAPDTRLGPLLFTIARNTFLSYRRWAVLDLTRFLASGDEVALARHEGTPEIEHERSQAMARLEAALAALPVASREILLLVGVEDLSQEEVAGILGISYDAVRQRLHRARTDLHAKMTSLEKSRRSAIPTPTGETP